jgi:hypothetical protein
MNKVFYLLLIFCAACGTVEKKVQEQKVVEEVVDTPIFQPKLNDLIMEDSTLLAAFYGVAQRNLLAKNPVYYSVLTLPTNVFLSDEADSTIKENGADTIIVTVADKIYYGEAKDMCVFITSTEIENFTCHPCGAVLGVFVLKKNEEGKWDCISYDRGLRIQGSSGYITAAPVVYKISDETWAVDVSQSYFGMGSSMQWEYHFITLDSNLTQMHIENEGEYFYEDDLGLCDSTENTIACFEYSSEIAFVKSDSSGLFYDLIMSTTGTDTDEEDSHKAHVVDRQRVYRWKDNKYVLIKDVSK